MHPRHCCPFIPAHEGSYGWVVRGKSPLTTASVGLQLPEPNGRSSQRQRVGTYACASRGSIGPRTAQQLPMTIEQVMPSTGFRHACWRATDSDKAATEDSKDGNRTGTPECRSCEVCNEALTMVAVAILAQGHFHKLRLRACFACVHDLVCFSNRMVDMSERMMWKGGLHGLLLGASLVGSGTEQYYLENRDNEDEAMRTLREKIASAIWKHERVMFVYGPEVSTDPLETQLLKALSTMDQPCRTLVLA